MDFQSTMSADCDVVLKIIMIGNSGVGKSALLKCFMGDPFQSGYTSTIGVDFEIKPVVVDGKTVNLQIWDTAGQERFRTITTSYYRSSDAIIMVFDLCDLNSFQQLNAWLEDVRSYAREHVDVLLVGNKVDLEAKRQVDYQAAKDFADAHQMSYIETSAKEDINVEKSFTQLTLLSVTQKNRRSSLRTVKPTESVPIYSTASERSSAGGCCR